MPLFSVDFSAVPFCFIRLHVSLVLRVGILSLVLVNNSLDEDMLDEVNDSEEDHACVPLKIENDNRIMAVHEVDSYVSNVVSQPPIRSSRLAGQNAQLRNGLNSRGVQKRRSSLKRRRARTPSDVGMQKANGALVTDLISSKKNGIPLVSVISKTKLRSSVCEHSAADIKDDGSSVVGFAHDIGLSSCNANILVIESDRCYRIEGATITLDLSGSGDWMLVMKKDGFTRYTHLAQKNMRPCTPNRITHDLIWSGDENWKLEFHNRQDWFIFKELYKECSDRNLLASSSKAIPIPGVHEVLVYWDINNATFTRTDAYISLKNDEVARALAKNTANYDMDSEDEEWLKTFNGEFVSEMKHHEHLSENNFELMIDAFEKAFYCSPDDFADDKVALNICSEFGRREVIEAAYSYWTKKRKQKQTALLRVFQGNQAKKAPLIPKPVLRKRRSFKRQCSQFGRGKQPTVLQVMAAERCALEEQCAMAKVEQVKISAKKSAEHAIVKRHRVQLLMENADLATYKAVMALRIAEAACIANPSEVTASDLLV
uniref:Enhancer of polycomb-like protein n=1 Tax=Rhizophora mucronata TaxID=61149 RepID=A0A2P2KFG7_RHIMU